MPYCMTLRLRLQESPRSAGGLVSKVDQEAACERSCACRFLKDLVSDLVIASGQATDCREKNAIIVV